MQQFAIVDDTAAYIPLQGFTSADLGYERGNAVSNMVTKLDEAPMTAQYVQLFDQIWHNPDQLDDVTDVVRDHIATVYAENSPARIYFLILYNLFAEFLEDIRDRREASGSRLTDYTEPVARIPQIVADELARDGIDIVRMWRDHPFELVQILRKRGYDNLFTTTKRIV